MVFSPLATYAFVGTNYNKVSSGDWTRYPVLTGQCINAVKYTGNAVKNTSVFSKIFGNLWGTIKNTAKGVQKVVTSDPFCHGVTKGAKFLANNINPMIVASGVTKVALAKKEDREKTLYSEGGMIAGMFLGEGWMKGHLDKVVLSKLPVSKKWMPVVKGTLFVAGSLTASTIGQKIGKFLFGKVESSRKEKAEKQALQLKEALQQTEKVPYEPLELKA